MKLTYHLFTDRGSYDHNEDSIGMAECGRSKCFVLADGLGGHGCGEVASKLAVEAVKQAFSDFIPSDSEKWLCSAFDQAQEAVLKGQAEDSSFHGMKTTMATIVIQEDQFQWGHIGDSRIYLFRRGKMHRRTLDHSVPQMLVASGEIKEKDIRGHADRNRLLRAIGTEWDRPRYEISRIFGLTKTDAFLLCSDGFWELIEEKTMEKLLKHSQSVEEWVEEMAKEVRKNGARRTMDNYSAIGIWIRE